MAPMLEITPGLRRWTAFHDHWEEDVGSLAVQTSDGLVLIDPIDPPSEVAAADHVLITVYWHGRSTGTLGAKRVWASARSERPLKSRGIEVTDPFRAGSALPGGIRAFQTARSAEVVYWLPDQRAVWKARMPPGSSSPVWNGSVTSTPLVLSGRFERAEAQTCFAPISPALRACQ